MNLIEGLKDCAVANRMFVEYYKRNGWQLPIPLKDFLTEKYIRMQNAIFRDFLAYCNISLFVTIKGYSIYIADPGLMTDRDKKAEGLLYQDCGNGWYLIEIKDVDVPFKNRGVNPDATLNYVEKLAIISAMKLLNTLKQGLNKNN